jgi:hypothetical protein
VTLQDITATNYNLTNGTGHSQTGNIDKIMPTIAELDFTLSNVAYDGLAHPVTVTPASGVVGLGAITVYYNGITTQPVATGTYAVTAGNAGFGMNYLAATGLPLGTFTIYEPPTPVIRRRVTFLLTPGMTTDPPAGSYYINSGTNFTFHLPPYARRPLPGRHTPAGRHKPRQRP